MWVLNKVLIHTQVYVKNTRVTKTVSYVCEGKQLGNKWHDYIRSVWQQRTVNKSINALLCCLLWGWDSKQCSSVQPKTEQLACFTQSFTMVLELVHRCNLQNQNDGTAGGNLQIKGRYYYNEIPLPRHQGSEIRRACFFRRLQKKAY